MSLSSDTIQQAIDNLINVIEHDSDESPEGQLTVDKLPIPFNTRALSNFYSIVIQRSKKLLRIANGIAMIRGHAEVKDMDFQSAILMEESGVENTLPQQW